MQRIGYLLQAFFSRAFRRTALGLKLKTFAFSWRAELCIWLQWIKWERSWCMRGHSNLAKKYKNINKCWWFVRWTFYCSSENKITSSFKVKVAMDLRAAYSSKRMLALHSLCVETTGEVALKSLAYRPSICKQTKNYSCYNPPPLPLGYRPSYL